MAPTPCHDPRAPTKLVNASMGTQKCHFYRGRSEWVCKASSPALAAASECMPGHSKKREGGWRRAEAALPGATLPSIRTKPPRAAHKGRQSSATATCWRCCPATATHRAQPHAAEPSRMGSHIHPAPGEPRGAPTPHPCSLPTPPAGSGLPFPDTAPAS